MIGQEKDANQGGQTDFNYLSAPVASVPYTPSAMLTPAVSTPVVSPSSQASSQPSQNPPYIESETSWDKRKH